MAIYIDKATVQRLIETRIETANDETGPVTLKVIHTGEPDPDEAAGEVWVRVAGIKMARQPRRSTDDEPWATIEIRLAVSCPQADSADSAYAIGSAVEHVSRVIETVTLDDSATSGHVIDLHQTEDEDERGGSWNQIVGSEIVCFGQVHRVSGTSQEVRH